MNSLMIIILNFKFCFLIDYYVTLKRRYRKWLWWTRFAAVITALQFLGAAYFLFTLMKFIYQDAPSTSCVLGNLSFELLHVHFVLIYLLLRRMREHETWFCHGL